MRIAVLGAGVAGLVAGMRLTEAGHPVDVYERWPGLGGQAATLDVGQGHLLERYYHHLFSTDRHIAALYEELGMPDELEWITSSVAYFTDGKQWPFVTHCLPSTLAKTVRRPDSSTLSRSCVGFQLCLGGVALSVQRESSHEPTGLHSWRGTCQRPAVASSDRIERLSAALDPFGA